MSKNKIGTLEAIALILSALAPFTVISISRTFINELKSSALLNIIYISIICTLIIYFIYALFKNFPGFDIIDISNYIGGSIFKESLKAIRSRGLADWYVILVMRRSRS